MQLSQLFYRRIADFQVEELLNQCEFKTESKISV